MSPLRKGVGDPTYRSDRDGAVWRGIRTPVGTTTLRVRRQGGEVCASAWGEGADWALGALPTMLGAGDDPTGFEPGRHPLVAALHRRHPHLRIGRTGLVWEALLPTVIEQKVTGQEAFAGYRRLVRRFGERAPGAGGERDLWVAPGPETVRAIPSWEWLRLPVDPARSRTIVTAAARAGALERTIGLPGDEVDRRLQSLPGVGVWTSAEVRLRAHGDADAVSFGDYNVAKQVGFALTGAPVDDQEMERLLAPFRPHRARVVRLIRMAGPRIERRGPRLPPRSHLPGRV